MAFSTECALPPCRPPCTTGYHPQAREHPRDRLAGSASRAALLSFASLAPMPPGPLSFPAQAVSVAEYLAEESRHGSLVVTWPNSFGSVASNGA